MLESLVYVIENLQNLHESTFVKPATLLKKRQVFSANFAKFTNTFLYRTPPAAFENANWTLKP